MGTMMICIAVATLGIDVGWQRLPEGGMEYIIQIEPQTLDALRSGEAIQSDIPTSVGDIRAYRIVVGSNKLPRETPPSPTIATQPSPPVISPSPQTMPPTLMPDSAMKPLIGQSATYVETAPSPATAAPTSGTVTEPQLDKPSKPWVPLIFTLFGLFASLGGNVFLGWIVFDLRKRCQMLLNRPAGT